MFAVLPIVSVLIVSGCEGDVSALVRGDRAWARGEWEKALAEYRLALWQSADVSADSARALVRLAHAYAELGQVDQAREYYARAVEANPEYSDQAVADLVRLARRAFGRGDRLAGALAAEAALQLRPGLTLPGLDLPLARYYAGSGRYGEAIPYLERALASAPRDSAPGLIYELALAYEELGDCERALTFFERYRGLTSWRARQGVEWHMGNCSLELGRAARARGRDAEALSYLQTVIRLGEPRNRLDEAYFETGEILLARGERDAALDAYRKVLEVSATGRGPLVERAERRIEEIRFGRR